MKRATAGRPARDIEVPEGIVLATVDPETGGRATAACPTTVVEAFLEADAPTSDCPRHGGAALDEDERAPRHDEREPERPRGSWWRRLFGR